MMGVSRNLSRAPTAFFGSATPPLDRTRPTCGSIQQQTGKTFLPTFGFIVLGPILVVPALLAPAAIAGAIKPARAPKAAGKARTGLQNGLPVALCRGCIPYLALLAALWSNVATGPSTYGPVSGGYIALLVGMTALPALVTPLAGLAHAIQSALLVLAVTVACASVGWIGGVITSPPDPAAFHGMVVVALCGPALVSVAASVAWAARTRAARVSRKVLVPGCWLVGLWWQSQAGSLRRR
jgi:hypothetical protein